METIREASPEIPEAPSVNIWTPKIRSVSLSTTNFSQPKGFSFICALASVLKSYFIENVI